MGKIYFVTKKTKVIMINQSTLYQASIIEESQEKPEIFSAFKPIQIIDHNCRLYGSTYSGRKEVVEDILESTCKLPIPVNSQQGIFLFPTHSIKNPNCVWVSYRHVYRYKDYQNGVKVSFKDGTSIVINNTSKTVFDRQIKRASQVIVHFNQHYLFGYGPKFW